MLIPVSYTHLDVYKRQAEDHPLHSIIQRIYDAASQLQQGLDKQLKKQSMLYWVSEQISKLFSHYMLYRADCVRGCPQNQACQCPSNWLAQWGRGEALNLEPVSYTQLDVYKRQIMISTYLSCLLINY